MIRAVFVEDEDLSAKRLVRMLEAIQQEVQVVKRLETVVDATRFLKNNQSRIDLVFLDIHLADGYSFEIFNEVQVNTPIIFTTAYDQYALQAFQQLSVGYLMKPIQVPELAKTMAKFKRMFYLADRPAALNYHALLTAINKSKSEFKKRFLVQIGKKIRSIDVGMIDLFYAENKACFLITNEGKKYDVNYTLEKLVSQLDQEQFFRLNRKIIVNIKSIEEVSQYSRTRYKVNLRRSPGFDVFIPTERIQEFKRWLNC